MVERSTVQLAPSTGVTVYLKYEVEEIDKWIINDEH